MRKTGLHTAVVSGILVTAAVATVTAEEPRTVREAYSAVNWYPSSPTQLNALIDRFLAEAKPPKIEGRAMAIIAPHAGYRFSGPVAAAAYRCLEGQKFERVMVLAFSHRNASSYRGVDVTGAYSAFKTPLGEVPVDRPVIDKLLKTKFFQSRPGIDYDEHSLELQLPYLQKVVKDFRLVPLYVGQLSDEECAAVAQTLLPFVDQNTLLVASSDFTHFGPNFNYTPFDRDIPEKLDELLKKAAAPLLHCDYDGFVKHLADTHDTICGREPIRLLLRILSMRGGAKGTQAAADTSGRQTGDWSNSVSYLSVAYIPRPQKLTDVERAELLRLARQTAEAFLSGHEPPKVLPDQLSANLRAPGACFVTMQNKGELRGCIGNMAADGPLYAAVIHNAISACQDSRFQSNPVTVSELEQIHFEISHLTPMRRVEKTDDIVIGRDGLLIELGPYRGVLLPQVAYERGWTRAMFLQMVCGKAGLPSNAWNRPEAAIYSFEAEVFGEPTPDGGP